MANKIAMVAGGAQGALQRGKACLRCRKRKMRCDGMKPACQQCVRAKKADCCEYDDGKGKTRTQILKETIARLEQRIRELEDPEYVSPAITLHDPHAYHHSESSSSSLGSPGSTSFSASHSPFPSDTTSSPARPWTNLPGVSPSATPFSSEIFFDEPQIPGPFDLAPALLDLFAPHRHQCGFEVHMGSLRDSLNLPMSEQRHPALMNAIYLWACFVSRPEPLCEHEDHFLTQAVQAHQQGLRLADKVLDIIQASCLLSLYFLANGRLLEGSYHASAAAALAIQMGLHVDVSPEHHQWMNDSTESFDLKPQKIDLRRGERVLAFWQVYNLDRCWSVVLRKPPVLPDGSNPWTSITCPWPRDMAEYDSGYIESNSPYHTIASFLNGDVASGSFSLQTLRAKASTLFGHADQLSRAWDSRKPSPGNQEQIRALEITITRFLSTLPPVHSMDATMPDDRQILITVHTLAHASIIILHQPFARDDAHSYDRSSRAARACALIIKSMTDSDFNFLDPIVGTCWTSAAEIIVRELDTLESSWPPMDSSDVRSELGTILYAMTSFHSRFPILGIPIAKVQKRLEV
ncbi:uncharacterized protein BT62DRAFT_1081491 [Guyanagaster necrorhizus]|uniref:Zn(2)-C6 fungal-type domain-containing protein n=1 Tax=Guyanagaster necrorhizus TaxID=856835 RepID=A0A9P8ALB5_9AGAR|nr:uncharacterized protein BT62DRAFT_1081491 [Guyanagaster necrorhizus MCA 3950]KAG7439610.1 hypothetical protein BT62DRAFT_1081491 [Guyanagaster necrorhizus MCA 3950]